jgi:hypothetical protein
MLPALLRFCLDRPSLANLLMGSCLTGLPEKGKLFCERVPFPEELLFLDPDRVAYRELALYEGIGRTFFSRATPAVHSFSFVDTVVMD